MSPKCFMLMLKDALADAHIKSDSRSVKIPPGDRAFGKTPLVEFRRIGGRAAATIGTEIGTGIDAGGGGVAATAVGVAAGAVGAGAISTLASLSLSLSLLVGVSARVCTEVEIGDAGGVRRPCAGLVGLLPGIGRPSGATWAIDTVGA